MVIKHGTVRLQRSTLHMQILQIFGRNTCMLAKNTRLASLEIRVYLQSVLTDITQQDIAEECIGQLFRKINNILKGISHVH